MRNRELAFGKKGIFFGGKLRGSVRISQGSKNFGFCCRAEPIIRTLMPMFARYSV